MPEENVLKTSQVMLQNTSQKVQNVLKTSQVMLQKGERKTMLQRPPQTRKEVGPGISLHIVLVHSLTLDPSESIELPLQNKRSYQSSEDKRFQILKPKNAEGKGHLKEAHWCAEDVTWFLSQNTPIFVFKVVHLAMLT